MQDDKRQAEIEIQTPCPKSWDSLVGDERRRFCSECNLHVHNSAALTRAEATELVREAEERLCMRVVRDTNGAPVYLAADGAGQPGACEGPIRPQSRLTGWILAAGAGLLSACVGETPAVVQPGPLPPPDEIPEDLVGDVLPNIEILGEVVCPDPKEAMGKVAPLEELGDVELSGCDSEQSQPIASDPEPEVDGADAQDGPAPTHEVMGRIALPPESTAGEDQASSTPLPGHSEE